MNENACIFFFFFFLFINGKVSFRKQLHQASQSWCFLVVCLRESVSWSLSQSISESVSGSVVLSTVHNRKCHFYEEAGRWWNHVISDPPIPAQSWGTTWYQIHQSQPSVDEPRDIRFTYRSPELMYWLEFPAPSPHSHCNILSCTPNRCAILGLTPQPLCYNGPPTTVVLRYWTSHPSQCDILDFTTQPMCYTGLHSPAEVLYWTLHPSRCDILDFTPQPMWYTGLHSPVMCYIVLGFTSKLMCYIDVGTWFVVLQRIAFTCTNRLSSL